jgi:hypothetical protein
VTKVFTSLFTQQSEEGHMKPGISLSAVLTTLFVGLPMVWAQTGISPEPYARYQYATKFVCGTSGENPLQVVKGTYATAVNVHNPSLYQDVVFIKKVAIAFPEQRVGPVSPFVKAELGPDQAFEVDCPEMIRMATSAGIPIPHFLKGFLVIITPMPLDVTAVYTARPTDGQVSTMDIDVIQPRVMPTPSPTPTP